MHHDRVVTLASPSSFATWRRVVACAAIACALAGSCLVATTPQFSEPQVGPIIVTPEEPDTRAVIVFDISAVRGTGVFPHVRVALRSEDGTAPNASPVQGRLFSDYGSPTVHGLYQQVQVLADIEPAHLTDPAREVDVEWDPNETLTLGCHTITLMLSHGFDDRNCPLSSDDMAEVSWFAVICDSSMPGQDDCNHIGFGDAAPTANDAGVTVSICPLQLTNCNVPNADGGT